MAQTKQLIEESFNEGSNLSAVERQTEASHKGGTIWEAVRKADQAALERLLDVDPNNVNARGPVGDCPIHMLFLYGTEAHLNMARYLLTRFPETVVQIYNQPVSNFLFKYLLVEWDVHNTGILWRDCSPYCYYQS